MTRLVQVFYNMRNITLRNERLDSLDRNLRGLKIRKDRIWIDSNSFKSNNDSKIFSTIKYLNYTKEGRERRFNDARVIISLDTIRRRICYSYERKYIHRNGQTRNKFLPWGRINLLLERGTNLWKWLQSTIMVLTPELNLSIINLFCV